MPSPAPQTILPHGLPGDPDARMQLVAIRRMAAFGLHDAQASLLMLRHFGLDYRRRLVLLRAFVHELAQASRRTIRLAPCCASRMTEDEAQLMRVLASAANDPEAAADVLAIITQDGPICHSLSLATMLAREY